jgi:hypothetical protein
VEVEFHESDFAPEIELPPTIEEKQRMLEELADLRKSNPIGYAEKKKQAADRLDVSQDAVPKLAVTAMVNEQDFATLLDRRLKKMEAMKLVEAQPQTIDGVDVRLPPRVRDRRLRRV